MNVLITAIGGDIAQTVLKVIRAAYPEARIFGTEIQSDNIGPLLADEFFLVPRAVEAGYLDVMADIVQRKSIDIVLPINEAEIMRWIKDVPPTSLLDMRTVRCRGLNLLRCFDKYSLNVALRDAGIQAPWSSLPGAARVPLPCVFKHRMGSGSKGMAIIRDSVDFKYFTTKSDGMFFQALLEPGGEEYTCGVYRSKSKEMAIVPLRRHLQGGLTGRAEIVADDEIIDYCRKVVDVLDLYGSINIQLIKTADGPQLFEINPRFSSTAGFRHHIGFHDIIWSIKEQLGKPFSLSKFKLEKVVGERFFRVYEEIYVPRTGKRF
jgi:carbamoyl-phosphate synthase large subunit